MDKILLESLPSKLNLTSAFCEVLAEAAIVCLSSQNHQQGVSLKITTDFGNKISAIFWETETNERLLKTHKDENRATDWGAMCISLFLALHLTEYDEFETSMKADGIDFWLSRKDEFGFLARLEISGIRKETPTNKAEYRVKTKKLQTEQSDERGLPAFISIVEFSTPKAIFVKK